ncbi:MAG: hypothetical protein OEU32_03585 [Acidimicrobiia bacterium]|nr:hypothetical protein [Acidimicrobiia bacterium]
MPTISEPRLSVELVSDHPGRRFVRIEYELEVDSTDPLIGRELTEHIVVHAVDEHDAPILPSPGPVVVRSDRLVIEPGRQPRATVQAVHRVELDVEQDQWRSDHAGEPLPIAEWLDHLVADISLLLDDAPVASATSPVLTGSWGPLGPD